MPPSPASGPSPPPPWAEDPDCPSLGPFLLGPQLGKGALGRVHLAWDPGLKRQVALKRLLEQDGDQIPRLLHEARFQARVDHPHVCQVLQVSEHPPFIAMQAAEGGTLGDLPLDTPLQTKVRLMAEAASGVHAAHRARLVHRDLKPGNILLSRREDGILAALVTDFGLAVDPARLGHSLSCILAGTPSYMAPEQARGEDPAPPGDIYSLGATLYALLTGGPPFTAATLAELLPQLTESEAPPLRKRAPGLARDLETILMKALASDPSRRYPTAQALEEDLRRFLAHAPVRARRPSLAYRLGRWIRRHRTLAAVLALSLAASGGLLAWNRRLAAQGRRQAEMGTRFGLEVKDLENHLRLHRMMPPHDLRPALAEVEVRIGRLRNGMRDLGPLAEGPGSYALGRAFLAKGDPKAALEMLKQAEAAGFRTPDTAYALGLAYARLLRDELDAIAARDPSAAAMKQALETRFPALGHPALEAFNRARGQALDHPAYGEAEVAWLQGDRARCLAKCREAYGAMPWLVEARRLEFQVLERDGSRMDQEGRIEARDRTFEAAWKSMESALAFAPSDETTLGLALEALRHRASQQSQSGGLTWEPLRIGDELYARASRLGLEDPRILRGLLGLRMRRAVYMLARGRDPRPMLLKTLEQSRALEPVPESRAAVGRLLWMLAGAQFYRGQDPRPSLAQARACFPEEFPAESAELDLLEARFLLARGQDPGSLLASALAWMDHGLRGRAGDPHLLQIRGEAHTLRALRALRLGLSPASAVRQGREAADASLGKVPNLSYAWMDRAVLETCAAEWAFTRGLDPSPALGRAHRAARRSIELRPDFHLASWVRVRALLLEARIRKSRGGNPSPLLDQTAAELRRARSINPASYLLQEALANLEILRGRGDRALEAARKGLMIKPDSVDLRMRLAEARRLGPVKQ